MMYIRNISDFKRDLEKQREQEKYCIKTGNGDVAQKMNIPREEVDKFLIRIRNVGRGPAFNVKVKSNNFKVEKYQSNFFAPEPKGDEQSIIIAKKNNEEIKNYEELKRSEFECSCKDAENHGYKNKYRIIDIEKQEIEFLG